MIKTIRNEEEWLKERLKGIGASEAASILGFNPWKNNQKLFHEKTSGIIEKINNPAIEYGKKAEQHIRELFKLDNKNSDISYSEYDMHINDEYPFIFATLDGLINNDGILEIKTTEIRNSLDWQKCDNKIPHNYYIQCLHQLLATSRQYVILYARIRYNSKDSIKYTERQFKINRRDVTDELDYLLKKEIEFWQQVQSNQCPALILPEI